MICDFCSSKEVRFKHEARDGPIGTLVIDNEVAHQFSEGGWAACPICHEYILEGNFNSLLKRSFLEFSKVYPDLSKDSEPIWMFLRLALKAFITYRTGQWTEVSPNQNQNS